MTRRWRVSEFLDESSSNSAAMYLQERHETIKQKKKSLPHSNAAAAEIAARSVSISPATKISCNETTIGRGLQDFTRKSESVEGNTFGMKAERSASQS
jgi:hypothetical protein